jgi:hypothetical protein
MLVACMDNGTLHFTRPEVQCERLQDTRWLGRCHGSTVKISCMSACSLTDSEMQSRVYHPTGAELLTLDYI